MLTNDDSVRLQSPLLTFWQTSSGAGARYSIRMHCTPG